MSVTAIQLKSFAAPPRSSLSLSLSLSRMLLFRLRVSIEHVLREREKVL